MSQKKIQIHKQHVDTPSQLITDVVYIISQWMNNNRYVDIYVCMHTNECIYLTIYEARHNMSLYVYVFIHDASFFFYLICLYYYS